jgi:hypothetical protein
MRKRKIRNRERGMALLIALLALLLVSAIGMGMMYMSSTETSINANYRDTQRAFFAMRAGLEEMRDRMRHNSVSPITLPTVTPTNGVAGSIVYILNPAGASDPVTPATYGSKYFDDELCHETFSTLTGLTNPGATIACGSAGAVPSTAFTTYNSVEAFSNTTSALNYKWVRITLKQNGTLATVDTTQGPSSQVCWSTSANHEVVASALGYANCTAAANAGLLVGPVYIITSLAYTPQGSRRIGQYETAGVSLIPPPAGLALDGPAAIFSPAPNSSQYFANGVNSGPSAYNGPGTCTVTTPAVAPAVSTGDQAGVTNILGTPPGTGSIPAGNLSNYTGQTVPPPTAPAISGSPSIVDEGTDAGGGNQLTGTWSSPSALNNLVATLANGADQTLSGCGISGTTNASNTACTVPTGGMGTDANPLITYVNGDFDMGSSFGAGILIVTGTLKFTGNAGFDGLVLVVGQGIIQENGGGNGQFNGQVFLADTNSHTSPFTQLSTLGSPQIAWNGGGTNGIQYNSCWANEESNLHYMVVSSREEMY